MKKTKPILLFLLHFIVKIITFHFFISILHEEKDTKQKIQN